MSWHASSLVAALVTNVAPQPGPLPEAIPVPGSWLRSQVLEVPIWEYLAFLVYLILAFYAARLVDYLLQALVRRWARRKAIPLEELLLAPFHLPVKALAFVLLLRLGLRVFAWPKWTGAFFANGLKLAIACALTFVAIKCVDLMMLLWRRRVVSTEESALDLHLLPLLRNTLKVIVLVVAVLVTSQNLGLNVTGLLASLSIGGLAVGLAAQDTLSNLLGAVALFADKPFRVGDHIQLEGVEGTVQTIGLRSTRVRNLEGHLVTIPNKTMAGGNISNVSKRPAIRSVLDLRITWETPAAKLERAIALIHEIYRAHPSTVDLLVSLNTFDSSALNLRVVHWWDSTSLTEYLLGFQHLNLELKRRLEAEGISFGSPSQNIYLRQDPRGPA